MRFSQHTTLTDAGFADGSSALRDRQQTELSRRRFLGHSGLGFGAAALAMLLQEDGGVWAAEEAVEKNAAGSPRNLANGAANPLAPRPPHLSPKAKRVIYLHMIGAPSQLDLFDPKPELVRRHGEACPAELLRGKRFAFIGGQMTLSGSQFRFTRHGESGQEFSELLPHLAKVADDLAIIKTVHTEEINHAPAQTFLHTGFGRGGRPSFGSWVTYGLGSENQNLPAYVVLLSGPLGGAGTALWGSGFLPSVYQGIQFRTSGDPVLYLGNPPGQGPDSRRRILDAIGDLNQQQFEAVADPEIVTRIAQYEMAFNLQTSAPELMDLSGEPQAVLESYGAQPQKPSFANNCLLARRLVERGVRVVELYDADWDHHGNLSTRLTAKCRDIDQAIAALIKDLKRLGLFEDTLVMWGSEFGRTPLSQGIDGDGKATVPGRDHHKDAFTCWLAGGGVKGGITYGQTNPFGFSPVENPVHVHDLNATVLRLLGLDHERLTFKYQGREFRLTDVEGVVQRALLR